MSSDLRDLETQMAEATTATAITTTTTRTTSLSVCSTITGANSRATRFITLISGLSAGPAVSLNGSPTVSPMTAALWESLPLPP